MDVKYINPFIQSVDELCSTMFHVKARRGTLSTTRTLADSSEFVAMVGITGEVQGNVALTIPAGTAVALVGKLLGAEVLETDPDTVDGVAEIVNMIAGGAKAKLNTGVGEQPLQLSLPTVLRGTDFAVHYPTLSLWMDIPFQSDLGNFNLRVAMKNAAAN